MSHTYATNIVHCVFSTKERVLSIPENRQKELWAYLLGIARNMEIKILAVGGVRDHLHLLISLPPKMNLATVTCDLKANSSKWLDESGVDFAWQQGYGAFSVSVFPALTRWANEFRPSGFWQRDYRFSKSTGSFTSCTRKYFASEGYFLATASYIA